MELYLLLRVLTAGLIALQCSVVCGSPAKRYDATATEENGYYVEYGDAADAEDYDDMKRDTNENMRENTVQLLSLLTGRFIHTTGDGLNSNGKDAGDSSTKFVQTDMSYSAITLTQDQQLLGIDNTGQILMDPRNSSEIAHEFEIVRLGSYEDGGIIQLRVNIGGSYCYIAFTEEGYPVRNACGVDSDSPETFFSMLNSHNS